MAPDRPLSQGWYPDPDRPGAMRWWDGSAWRGQGAAVGPDTGSTPDSFAVAAFVLALLGIPLVPIYMGVRARTRIRESGGTRDGAGLAVVAIAFGVAELVIAAVVLVVLLG
jgi:hypothetical protein